MAGTGKARTARTGTRSPPPRISLLLLELRGFRGAPSAPLFFAAPFFCLPGSAGQDLLGGQGLGRTNFIELRVRRAIIKRKAKRPPDHGGKGNLFCVTIALTRQKSVITSLDTPSEDGHG